jgi:hypothetical protein
MARSKFLGQVVDERDYDRRLHYFLAIPIGWDRVYQKQLTQSLTVINENEVGVAGVAYAGVYTDAGTGTGHGGANLARTVNSIAFEFVHGNNTFTVTPMEFTNDAAVFHQGVNDEWEASGTFEYVNSKTTLGFTFEAAHKSGLPLYGNRTASENIFRPGVSVDPVKAAEAVGRTARRMWTWVTRKQ